MSDLRELLDQLDAARAAGTPGEWWTETEGGRDMATGEDWVEHGVAWGTEQPAMLGDTIVAFMLDQVDGGAVARAQAPVRTALIALDTAQDGEQR